MSHNDGLKSYKGVPVNARVMGQKRLEDETWTPVQLEDRLKYLRGEWRAAKTVAQREAIEEEAAALKEKPFNHPRHNHQAQQDADMTDMFGPHYDNCDGYDREGNPCTDPQCPEYVEPDEETD